MGKEFLLLERFVLQKFRTELKQLDIEADYIDTTIKYLGEDYRIRIEGDLTLAGEFRWMLSSSIKLEAYNAMN